MTKIKSFIKLLLIAAPALAIAQKKVTPLPLDPVVKYGKLPNGFTYFIRKNTEPKNRVVIYLANKVGSVLETDDQQGLAHFMEHMNFNGTKNFPKNELVNYLQKIGVRFGADLNAYTGFDETVYQLPLPTDDPAIVKNGLQIMRDWAQDATLETDEINKERGVVLEERRLGMGAGERMNRKVFPFLLNNSRYAERIPIGKEDVLKSFDPEVIRRYHHDWYRPDLQALIVVGDIDPAAIEKQVKEKFANLKNPEHERPRVKYAVPLSGKSQFLAVTDKEMPSTVVEIVIKHKASHLITEADYRDNLTRQLFNIMLAQRYTELAQKGNPPFIQCNASIDGFLGDLDAYGLALVAKPGELEQGFKAGWRETERVKRFGFTASELSRAKELIIKQMQTAAEEKGKSPSEGYVKEYLQYFLHKTASPGIDAELRLATTQLPGISLQEVNAQAKEYIRAENRDIVIEAPEKDAATLPTGQQCQAWLRSVENERLEPYQDNLSGTPLLSSEPTPGKIVSEKLDSESGISTLTLSNGVKVVLKPTDFKNNEILFNGFSAGGTSLYSDRDFQSAANAAGIVGSYGAGNYDAIQLQKYMEGKLFELSPYLNEQFQGIGGRTVPADLKAVLELIYARMTAPRKDSVLFASIIERSKAAIANRNDDPSSVFQDSLAAVLGNHNPRVTGPTLAKIAQIDFKRSAEIYQERFGDASGFTFVFVGSFKPEQIKPLIEKYIASLPTSGRKESWKDLGIHTPSGHIEKNVYKGTENKSTVRLVFSGPFDYTPENELRLDALKEVLEYRMIERLREEESGVYAPSVSIGTAKLPTGRFRLMIAFGCAPQNVDKLVASALDEINHLKTQGPPEVNLLKYKAEEKRQNEINLRTNDHWMEYITTQLQNKEDLHQYQQEDHLLNALSADAVKKAANDYLSGENYIRVVLLPETNEKGK